MTELIRFIIDGISDGSVYAIAGLGLVLTYKTSGIFNFASGAQAAAAAYLFYQFRIEDHLPWPVAALLAVVLIGVVGGLILERIAFCLAHASTAVRVVAMVGVLVFIQSLLIAVYGAATLEFPSFLPTKGFRLASLNILGSQVIILGLALGSTLGLYLFFRKVRLGVAMQAVVDNPSLLGVLGTNPVLVRRWAWTIGGVFVAVSGCLLAPALGVNASTLILLVVQAFAAAAIGGFTSLPWTLFGGLALGIAEDVGSWQLSLHAGSIQLLQEIPPNLPFIVIFFALLLAPKGRLVERGGNVVRRLKAPVAVAPQVKIGTAVGGLAVLLVIPAISGTLLNSFTTALAFALLYGSLALVVWTSGQVSLCQASFAAVGAVTFGHAVNSGVPWLFALVLGGLMAIPVGAIVAIPAIRLSGIYLAIATFGFGILLEQMFYSTSAMFGQGDNLEIPRPLLFGLHTATDTGYYYVVLAVVVVGFALIAVTQRSRLGRFLRGMADSPAALNAHGASTNLTRLFVFCLSAFLAGVSGSLIAGVTQSANGSTFDFSTSLEMIVILAVPAAIGLGRRLLLTPFLAAGLAEVAINYAQNPTVILWAPVALGVLAVIISIVPGIPQLEHLHVDRRTSERLQGSPAGERWVRARLAIAPKGVRP